MKLNENELRVLQILVESYDTTSWGETGYFAFAALEKRTGFDRRHVRLACRSLARKGFAHYLRGLVTEDGEMAGSGYGATKEGYVLLNPCDIIGCKEVIGYDWYDEADNTHRFCEEHYQEYKKQIRHA